LKKLCFNRDIKRVDNRYINRDIFAWTTGPVPRGQQSLVPVHFSTKREEPAEAPSRQRGGQRAVNRIAVAQQRALDARSLSCHLTTNGD
jgi:hypothetical protein